MKSTDLSNLQETKDFLYGDMDIEKINTEVRLSINNHAHVVFKNRYQPSHKLFDKTMVNQRHYKADLEKMKKDVTIEEL